LDELCLVRNMFGYLSLQLPVQNILRKKADNYYNI